MKGAGRGDVDRRDQLADDIRTRAWPAEEVQDVGGDGELIDRRIAVASSAIGRSGGSSPTGRSPRAPFIGRP